MSAKKEGLDYFPFSVDLLDDEKLDILREEHGVAVNDVYISLLCLLYKKKGYYIPYETEQEKKDCVWYVYKHIRGGKYPVKQNAIPEVIESLVSQGLFSGRYFPKIITSERAQRTYYSATVERKADSLNINQEYWLLSKEDMEKLSKKHPYYLSCTHFSKSTDLDCKSTDLSLKESKVKEKESPNPFTKGGGKTDWNEWKVRFFDKYTAFAKKNYKDDGVDYKVLYQEFECSSTLRSMWSFPRVISLYQQIAEGAFRDKQTEQQRNVQASNDRADRERYYAQLREKADARMQRALAIAKKDERFNEAVKSIGLLGIKLAKAEVNQSPDVESIQTEFNAWIKRKADILRELGLTEKDLLPQYRCEKCNDTGWLQNGKACGCYARGELNAMG